jgi:Ca-activated chloride channel family protein
MMVMDTSGSMATVDFIPREGSAAVGRLEAAKQAIALFVAGGESADGLKFSGRPEDRIGLITFASVPVTVCPLTFNHTVLLEVLRNQGTAGPTNAETNIGDALGEGCVRLETLGPGRRKVLVLLSDGEHNKVGENVLNPRTAAALAEKLQIPIYTIDCGGDPSGGDETANRQRNDGRAVLEEVSRQTGGQSFVANNGIELRNAFASIDTLERQTVETPLYRQYKEYRGPLGGIALGLLAISGGLSLTRWRRNP